ncbi:MAG: hypothetical protein R2699_05480 [Acidimicrobiales bacterium]
MAVLIEENFTDADVPRNVMARMHTTAMSASSAGMPSAKPR